jgi:hypothetical protein
VSGGQSLDADLPKFLNGSLNPMWRRIDKVHSANDGVNRTVVRQSADVVQCVDDA